MSIHFEKMLTRTVNPLSSGILIVSILKQFILTLTSNLLSKVRSERTALLYTRSGTIYFFAGYY